MDELKFDDRGLITAVVQDRLTGQIRMVAWMNQEALDATLATGFATFFSRSRGKLWKKGESSGNTLRVAEVFADCDGDTLVLMVDPRGPSCHTGRDSCFYRPVELTEGGQISVGPDAAAGATPFLSELEQEIESRATSTAERSYTRSLLDGGVKKINGKIVEEAGELCEALSGEPEARVASEAGDVLYHLLVGLRARAVPWRSVIEVLASRAGRSGHEEKASRG